MSGLKRLIREIHRRSLWQVLAIYAVASWVIYQIVQSLTEGLGLPDWFPALAVVLLLVGLPIVLATAFVQEGAPLVSRRDPTLLPGYEAVTAETQPIQGTKRLFTWRNAILGGVLAFTLLGIGTAGYMAMRLMGIGPAGSLLAKGVLQEREPIILADFQNNTKDPMLAIAITEAFRIDLSQSPVVRIAAPEDVRNVLARMQMATDAPLTADVAREVALREGLRAVISGEVSSVGGGFVLAARLVSAEDGEIIAAHRETANDSTAIIPAIDRLSRKLRERIGESLKTIRPNPPLGQVTTASLEALRKGSQALRVFNEGDFARAIALYQEAVALDSGFAMAYLSLGAVLQNMGERAQAVAAFTKAFEHGDRLTDSERYSAEAQYYMYVTGENDKAITAYRTLLETYEIGSNQLATLYHERRDYAQADELYRRAIEEDSSDFVAYLNAATAQVALSKFDEARATLERLAAIQPDNPWPQRFTSHLTSARGDYDGAEGQVRALRAAQGGELFLRAVTSRELSDLAKVRGRLSDAERHLRDAMAAEGERGSPANYLQRAAELAELDVRFRGKPTRALETLRAALDRYPLDSIEPIDRPYVGSLTVDVRPYGGLASFYALAGSPEQARGWLDEYESVVEAELRRGRQEPLLHRAKGVIALAEGRAEEAIAEFRRSDEGECANCALPDLGRAYDLMGQADSVIAIYERYISTPSLNRLAWDADNLAFIYERLGVLYESRGDTEKAIYYYGEFVELWKDADPELQPRVEAARRAIAALSPDQ